ncbi:MAG: response regulator [Chitinophagaceae bacterium]|nr:response regulator [Chitinophagaceae bacterium]
MEKILKILMLEDSGDDAGLIQRELISQGLSIEVRTVDTRQEFEHELRSFKPDVILSDHSMPGFNSIQALHIHKEINPRIPFILVTGTVSEEFAVQALQDGADDYILKDKLTRLPSAIQWAIEKHELADKKERAEKLLVEQNEELKTLAKHLKNVREDERKYISREIHDQLGQLASAIKIEVDWLNINLRDIEPNAKTRIKSVLSTVTIMIDTIRNIAMSLRPSIIEELGLNASLKWQCREFQRINKTKCDFEESLNEADVDEEVRIELFRICQECLTNVMRHARADRVVVSIADFGDRIGLRIADDGKGFDTNQKSTHLGLVGLRERALSVGGEMNIDSAPGKGTTITVFVPKRPN